MSEGPIYTMAACPKCQKTENLTNGAFKVHFARVQDQKPCIGSWKSLCSCGQLVHAPHGKQIHLDDGSPSCKKPSAS